MKSVQSAKRLALRLGALGVIGVSGWLVLAQRGQTPPGNETVAIKNDADTKPNNDRRPMVDPFAAGRLKTARHAEPDRLDDDLAARPLRAANSQAADDPFTGRSRHAGGEMDGPSRDPAGDDPFGLHADRAGKYPVQQTAGTLPDTSKAGLDPLAGDPPDSASRRPAAIAAPLDTLTPALSQGEREKNAVSLSPAGGTPVPQADNSQAGRGDPYGANSLPAAGAQPVAIPLPISAPVPLAASGTLPPDTSLAARGLGRADTDLAANSGEGTGHPGNKQLEGSQTPRLQVEKIAPPEVQVGKAAVFRTKVRNAGDVTAQDVEIRDELPHGTQLVKTVPAAQLGPHGELIWSLGAMKPGDETTVQMEVMPLAEGEIGSVAAVHFRAEASARTMVTRPGLTLQISGPAKAMIGSDVTLKIKLSNPGSGTTHGVMLEEKVPPQLKHPAGPDLEFEVGDLKPGETHDIELVMTAAKAGKLVNTLVARAETGLRAEERADLEVVAPGLTVGMTGPTHRYLQRQATYTVSVSNPGTAPAKDVQLVTYLPKGLKFVKANNAGTYDAKTNSVQWSLAELPAAETGNVTLVALPVEMGEQKLRIDGKAQQGLTDHKEQTITVEGFASVAFEVSGVDGPIEIGGQANYEIHVVNQGTKSATNIQVTCLAPAEAKPVGADGPARYTIEAGRVVFEPLPRLAPKADATYKVKLQALAAGDLRFKVQLQSDEIRTPITKEENMRVFSDQ